jgi:hypothetical protein
MIAKPPQMLTPQWRRAEELGLAPNVGGRPLSTQVLRDPFHQEYMGIINEAKALIVAVLELSIEPGSVAKSTSLKDAARSLKRRCNGLVHRLARAKNL